MSFVGTSAAAYSKSLQGNLTTTTSNTNLELIRDVYRYQILNKLVVEKLNYYIGLFTTGDYKGLKDEFVVDVEREISFGIKNNSYFYSTYVEKLDGFEYSPAVFNSYRLNTESVLTGLNMAIKQYDTVEKLNNEITYFNSVLESEESIINYLNSNKEVSQMAFSTNQVFNVRHVLKPWYERYLIQYGAPNDGVFQTGYLAAIAQELINEGVITLEQFTTDTYPS